MIIDGVGLSPSSAVQVARFPAAVSLSASAVARAQKSFDYAADIAATRPIYGRSTGVGANRGVAIFDPSAQASRLLRSHATSAGPLRSQERIRAMLIVRLNQLAAGGSGVSPAVLSALASMISADALPPVREWGGIGTADLSALAVTALCLTGDVAASGPLPQVVPFDAGDALPFMSSNAATLGDAALALVDLRELAAATLAVCALTAQAVDGNAEAFSPAVESVTPFPGARRVCRELRSLLPPELRPARIQDPFGLRAMPQVHGAFFDALTALDGCVTAMINAASENPVFLPSVGVAHHGGFHAAYLAQALDAVVLASAQSSQLSLSRLGLLIEPSFTGLSPFLGDGTPGASGVMVAEYVAASALGSLWSLAQPASLQTVTLSRKVEDDASFGSLAARQALDAVATYRTVLACELVAAVRCLRMRSQVPASALLARCDGLDAELADRDLTGDITCAESILADFSAQLHGEGASEH